MTMTERAAACLREPEQTLIPPLLATALATIIDALDPLGRAAVEQEAAVIVDAFHEATFSPPE